MNKKRQILVTLCLTLVSVFGSAQTQTWQIGSPVAKDVIATLSEDGTTLTISGNGAMMDYGVPIGYDKTRPPFYEYLTSISTVKIENGVSSIGNYAFYYAVYGYYCTLTEVTIPSSVTSIGQSAFGGCTSLTELTIPEGVESVGPGAFGGCSNFRSVKIPSTVTNLGWEYFNDEYNSSQYSPVFGSCPSLVDIVVDSNNPAYLCEDSVLYTKNKKTLLICSREKKGEFIIPNTVNTIDATAFLNCKNLTTVVIPEGVRTIDMSTFRDCSGLTTMTIPGSVWYINNYAFRGCSNLTKVTIHKSQISSFMIGVFDGCSSLTSIINLRDVPYSLSFNPFGYITSTCTLYVPTGSKTAYEKAKFWQDFDNIVELSTETLSSNSALIEWVNIDGADYYVLIVYNDASRTQEIGRYQIDSSGKTTRLQARASTQESSMLSCNVEDLSVDTEYYYTLTSYNATNQELSISKGNFKTLDTSGITNVEVTKNPVAYYSVMGVKLSEKPEKGVVYIVQYDNGTIEKRVR